MKVTLASVIARAERRRLVGAMATMGIAARDAPVAARVSRRCTTCCTTTRTYRSDHDRHRHHVDRADHRPGRAPPARHVSLTEGAAVKVRALLDQEGRDDLRLRVAVQPGGCSGLQYQLFFDERSLDGDVELDLTGVPVVVDRMSAPYLGGATIDFTDTIEQQGFTIDNPNAGGGCACGNSFCG